MLTTTAQRALASFSRNQASRHFTYSLISRPALQIARDRFTKTAKLSNRLLFTTSRFRMADVSSESAAPPVKTAKQLKKEAEKLAKMEKFKAKQAKKEEGQKQASNNKVRCVYKCVCVWLGEFVGEPGRSDMEISIKVQ